MVVHPRVLSIGLAVVITFGSSSADGQARFRAPAATITGADGAQMVLIPFGEFWMGLGTSRTTTEPSRRQVSLGPYYIDKYEVTNEFHRKCVRAGACTEPVWNQPGGRYNIVTGSLKFYNFHGPSLTAADHPVVGVSWRGAAAYCLWAGKRLPTEAEWEKAARGTDERVYPWGNEFESSRANWGHGGPDKLVAVGTHPGGVSPYGVHDMAGNVFEWVANWWLPPDRVVKGGPFQLDDRPSLPRSTYRVPWGEGDDSPWIGFRCARETP